MKEVVVFELGKRRNKFFLRYMGGSVAHGRASTSTSRAFASAILCFWWVWNRHGSCQAFWSTTSKKILFFASYLDKYLQNKLKQHKTNKIKQLNMWVASHEALV